MAGGDKDKGASDFSFGHFCARIPDAIFPVIGGCVAFGSTLALSTAAQKVIGVSTATKIVISHASISLGSSSSRVAILLSSVMKKQSNAMMGTFDS